MGCQVDHLELRQYLKDKYLEKKRKESCGADVEEQPPQNPKNRRKKDNYGNFFGPSVTEFPQRVIELTMAVLETMPYMPKNKNKNNNPISKANSPEPTLAEDEGGPKKITKKKESRDYSFLSSDDPQPSVSIKKEEPKSGNENKTVVNISKRRVMSDLEPKKSSGTKLQPVKKDKNNPSSAVAGGIKSSGTKLQSVKKDDKNPSSAVAGGIKSSGTKLQSVKKEPLEKKIEMGGGEARNRKLVPNSKSKEFLMKQKKELKRKYYSDEEDSDEEDSDEDYDEYAASRVSSMISKIMGYDRRKYQGMRDDDRNMEASFSDIQKEERRSAKLGKKEDEIELMKIEKEEKEERLRKAKKRKLQSKEKKPEGLVSV